MAEVIYPNTIPPFYPEHSLKAQVPGANEGDLEPRWEGLRAHNRWLGRLLRRRTGAPGRHRPGHAARRRRRRGRDGVGGRGGDARRDPVARHPAGLGPRADVLGARYEPIWSACEAAGLPINHHSGSAVPAMGDEPIEQVVFMLEVTWWAHRALWHLIFSGVMERHPDLQFVFTEQGTAWLPETLGTLDFFWDRMGNAVGSQEYEWGHPVVEGLSLRPSEYWARQCHVGSSFMRPAEAALRHTVGLDTIMWGSDYPHKESSFPYSRQALRLSFASVDPAEVQEMVGANAARLYGFDLGALAPVASVVGPTHAEIAEPLPLGEIPPDAIRCPAFVGLKR